MLHRREILQVGCSSFFGLTLPGLLQQQATAAVSHRRAKSVVLVFLTGGASHIDMFDPKPDVPEVRGEFHPIATRIPGVQFSEMMPKLADRAHRLAVVRSMSHGDNRHLSGSHNTLTGSIQSFRGNSNDDKSLNRADWPSYGSAIGHLRPRQDGLPSQITVPNPLIEGALVWPGQHAGFLGAKYDPFQLNDDPNNKEFQVSGLKLPDGLSVDRLDNRWQLLRNMDRQRVGLNESTNGRKYTTQQETAYSMLTSAKLKKAFHIQSEPQEVRDRYGRHTFGQTLLLARRLLELETPVIQCNMGRVQTWDTHVNHFPRLKDRLLPQLDQGVSALLDDLVDRGLLDQTQVVVVGEFGRTPQISPLPGQKIPGRHHWASGYTAVFAGAGVRGGQVIGKTDRIGAYPVTVPFRPNDIGATIFDALGINTKTILYDRLNRPRHLNQGKVMDVLFSGTTS